jgi:predicted Zn-dependent peptidase
MHDAGADESEVGAARDYLAGVMPLELQTAAAVADALTELFIHDLPDDWHRHHREQLAAVPVDEVARVARHHLSPETATILVVGDAAIVGPGLEGLGRGTIQVHTPE